MIRNKARLVAQEYTQEEGIDYDEVFSPVARIKAIRLFLAYALFKGFVMYQMDVKSVFLYGKIEEGVYVCQPLGFEDPDFPDKVYKVEKALYGLHQAPRAWYETLSTYLLDNRFERGKIDKTLFIRKHKGDILLVQVYVDDIIFGSTNKKLCIAFEKLMHEKFQISSMRELTFFLELQVQQKKDDIFISQDKYDEDGEEVDVHMHRSMIGSLMYLTSSRPDIMFAVCACARYQVNPKVSHLHAVKRIFRYLKGQPKLGIWYPKDSPFDLVAYTDSDYAGASLDRKSTIGGCQFLRSRLISWQCKKQTVVANSTTEAEYVAASSCCGQVLWIQNQLLDYGDCNEKKLIQMVKIYTDKNIADLLTKAFDPVDPPSPDYVPGPEHPASPDYVPGLEHPPSPIEIPFVPEPEYPEYLREDPEEVLEEEHADYPADGGDGDDEPSGDDTDDDDADDDDEEPFEDEEDDEEEEEHLAPADSSAIPAVDPVPSAGDTEAFETDESAPTP
ncbi:putative ribonuclease H-like domain-containing protein [Tanacetum coccineum]